MWRKVAGDGRLEIGPLENLPVIKDLATDMAVFFAKWQEAKGVFAPSKTRRDAIEQIKPESPARRAADAAIECINCGVCYAGCDTVRWNSDYLGPAALTRAFTLVNDVRDAGNTGAPASRRGDRRLPCLPLAPILPGTVPAVAQPDGRHRCFEAARRGGLSQGRNKSMNVRLYIWQRATAALMAPLVLIHIAVIFYATRQGLTAADILSRTHGSVVWASYYGIFVAAASIHASIGIRNIFSEWSPLNERRAGLIAIVFGLLLAALGARAVAAVVLS